MLSNLKTTTLAGALAMAALPALAQENPMVGGAEMFADRTIVENAVNSADHTTLVAAVQAAGLVETLSGPGPFTVFAPTNAAFAALPEGTVDTLLQPDMADDLTQVLTCHVISGAVMADAIGGMIADDGGSHAVPTLGGCTLQAQMDGENITLTDEQGNTATVTIADVRQSNGVIHVIDTVMLPAQQDAADDTAPAATADTAAAAPEAAQENAMPADAEGNPIVGGASMLPTRTIVGNAVNSADHTTLVAAVQAAELVETLEGPGPFTVFAPTNAAFAALPEGTVETLLMPENREQLTKVLTAHVVSGKVMASDLASMATASPTGFYNFNAVSGDALSAQVQPSGSVYIFDENSNAYAVTIADVEQSNGVIHVVEGVLLPR